MPSHAFLFRLQHPKSPPPKVSQSPIDIDSPVLPTPQRQEVPQLPDATVYVSRVRPVSGVTSPRSGSTSYDRPLCSSGESSPRSGSTLSGELVSMARDDEALGDTQSPAFPPEICRPVSGEKRVHFLEPLDPIASLQLPPAKAPPIGPAPRRPSQLRFRICGAAVNMRRQHRATSVTSGLAPVLSPPLSPQTDAAC